MERAAFSGWRVLSGRDHCSALVCWIVRSYLDQCMHALCNMVCLVSMLSNIAAQHLSNIQRRVLRAPSTMAANVQRMEVGRRSYNSWMDQRKLEYAYRMRAPDGPVAAAAACVAMQARPAASVPAHWWWWRL